MRSRGLAERLPIAVAAVLVLLLAVLALLQWRWIGEVSALERQRMRAGLAEAGSGLAQDFDREVTRVFLYFHPELHPEAMGRDGERPARAVRQYERYRAEAPYPRLVRDVFLVVNDGKGGLALQALRPEARRFEPCPWPAELAALRCRLESQPPGVSIRDPEVFRGDFPLALDVPALVIPSAFSHPPHPGHAADPWAGARLVVRLDERAIAGEILPALTRRHFGTSRGGDYALAVLTHGLGRGPAGRTIFLSDPRVPAAAFRTTDVRLPIFGLRPFEELHSLGSGLEPGPGPENAAPPLPAANASPRRRTMDSLHRWVADSLHPRAADPLPPGGAGPFPPLGREGRAALDGWSLLLKHRDGSLEDVVAALRRRNLAVSLGILALLAATAAMMMVTTERARRLARQQIEFVAGVTHEVNTPLTAIRSAGQNLADGVTAEPAQVRRYGALIESEGRRLSSLLGQALELAGIQSGRRVYHRQPVAVGEVVDGALEDCRWLLEERGIAVERDVARGLPPVPADAAALRRALANLVENAVKHGGRAGWIGIAARRAADSAGSREPAKEIEITVSDRGPGIRREDLPRLFEPFYRGRDAAVGGVPGSGLGLALVRHTAEAHGGRVTVVTAPGEGSAFTLHLPAAAAPVAAAPVETLEGTGEMEEPA